MAILKFIIDQLLTKPPILLGLVTLIGLALQGKSGKDTATGTIKTILGISLLTAGSGLLTGSLKPVMSMLYDRFALTGVQLEPYSGQAAALAALKDAAAFTGPMMVTGFVVNLIIARTTKFKVVFLTGHVMLMHAVFMTWLLQYMFGLTGTTGVVVGGILLGTYWTLLPYLCIKQAEEVIGAPDFTDGHQQMAGVLLAGWLAPKVGDPKQSAEEIHLPGWLSILEDFSVMSTILMTVFFGIIAVLAGPAIVSKYSAGQHWLIYGLLRGVEFTVALTVVLSGVRMFIAEIVPAFKGISEKVIPGAIPAVDVAAFLPFGPKSVTLGFLSKFLGEVTAMAVLLGVRWPVIPIPGMIPLFFDGGPIGVFANKRGGVRAVIICGVLVGMMAVFGVALVFRLTGLSGGYIGNFDWSVFWALILGGTKSLIGLVRG
ncbi:MAG: PTS ascorbate transporter subunit IIC [Firmicutes bacterium]|nr:PTS ascorbate transporter subunit IIC [Bacillota bacterium]